MVSFDRPGNAVDFLCVYVFGFDSDITALFDIVRNRVAAGAEENEFMSFDSGSALDFADGLVPKSFAFGGGMPDIDCLLAPNGERRPLPQIDAAAALHLRPDGYQLKPIRIGDDVFETFLALAQVASWERETSKTVVGKSPVLPDIGEAHNAA